MPLLVTLKSRSEFLRVRGGARASSPAFVIEAKPRSEVATSGPPTASGPRFGFTITKKIGNAVVRNRIRRRLKAALSGLLADYAAGHTRQTHDYVVIARVAAHDIPFATLQKDLERALQRVHHAGGTRPGKSDRRV